MQTSIPRSIIKIIKYTKQKNELWFYGQVSKKGNIRKFTAHKSLHNHDWDKYINKYFEIFPTPHGLVTNILPVLVEEVIQ